MSDDFERKEERVALPDAALIELEYLPRLSNTNIFVWHQDKKGPWTQIHSDSNQSGRVVLGPASSLKDDSIELSFEIKKPIPNADAKFRVSGHLLADGKLIKGSNIEFKGSTAELYFVRVCGWSFT